MTASQKYAIAIRFELEGNTTVYNAIMDTLTADELLELLAE